MTGLERLYQASRVKADANGAVLETYPPARLAQAIKANTALAEDAAVVLLQVYLPREQLSDYFTDEEIHRYFSKLPG